MRWPDSLSPETFLAEYWQKQPLYLPASIDLELPRLDPDELAWLATQPDVESRLVWTDRGGVSPRYRVEQGPFADSELEALPAKDWTLLVQDVEKHLPDFRAYFQLVPFVPAWRLDDLMISLAAPGGSVGPHKDNYDVFLCQVDGQRDWRLSDDHLAPADSTRDGQSLLRPFEPSAEHHCRPGDILYIPPGIPHWGIATDICTTYSIGLRAPTKAELVAAYARLHDLETEPANDNTEEIFYADPGLQLHEAQAGEIAMATLSRLREQGLLDGTLNDDELLIVLGSTMTDPKAWLDPEGTEDCDVSALLERDKPIEVHGMALLASCRTATTTLMFANGRYRAFPEAARDAVRTLCADRVISPATLRSLALIPGGPDFIAWLYRVGVFDGP